MTNLSEGLTPFDVANSLVGSGVDSIANVQYIGSNLAGGAFAGGDGIIGIESGVVLTSGLATNVVGPNDAPNKSHAHALPGDADLNLLIAGLTTHDASVLSFDITPNGNVLTMRYVFASEEYNEYVGSNFNDVIGLFVNGVNYARLPGSNSAVTINNVNGQTNPEFFVDNLNGALDTQLDGLTVVLTMTAPVNPGVPNHIKIAIADASDDILDSAVFLEALSILSIDGNNPPTLAPIGNQTVNLGETLTFTATATDADDPPDNLLFSLDGAPDGASIDPFTGAFSWMPTPMQAPGDYSFIVRVTDDGSPSFFDEERITVTLIDPNPNQPPSIVLGGSAGAETDAFTQECTWNVTDDRGLAAVEVAVFQLATGSQILSSTDASGSFNFDAYGPGTFLMLVSAVDSNSLTAVASQSATISDDDTAAPLIVLGGSSGAENDGQTQQFTWNASDASGLSSISVTVTQDGNAIFTSSDASGTFSFDAFGLGTFVLTATATDADSDWSGDSLTSSISSSATVIDDDTAAPIIVLGGSSGTESETQTQFFTWNVTDDSGLSVLEVVITQDTGSGPVEIYRTEDTADAVGSFNFDGFGPGDYELAVSAFDADADWLSDVAQSIAARMATVTASNRPPVLALPGPFAVAEGQTLTFQVSASDPDLPPDTLIFGLIGGPAGSSLDPVTGVFSWRPDCEAVGQYTVTFTVSDGRGGVDSETVVLRALGVTAQARLDGTMARIENLVTAGILNRGQGQSLIAKLRAVQGQLDREHARAASVLLDSFNTQVNRLVTQGALTSAQAATLETPSIVYWDGEGDGVSWNDPLNWSRDRLPEACDDVYIRAEPNATIVHPAGNVAIHSLHSSNALDFQGSLVLATASSLHRSFAFAGTLLMQSGPLDLTGGGDLAGTITVQAGAEINFLAGTFGLNAGLVFDGAGEGNVGGGAAGQDANLEVEEGETVAKATFNLMDKGTISGSGTLRIEKELNWTGGRMEGEGITEILAGAKLNLSGMAAKVLQDRQLINAGAATWEAGVFRLGGEFLNLAKATFVTTIAGNGRMTLGGMGGVFTNQGLFEKRGTSGTISIEVPFNNAASEVGGLFVFQGKVVVAVGNLEFRRVGEHSGIFVVNQDTEIRFLSAVQTLNQHTTFEGNGLFRLLDGGTLEIPMGVEVSATNLALEQGPQAPGAINGPGTMVVTGHFTWTGGEINAMATVDLRGTAEISGPAEKTLDRQAILINSGDLVWFEGNFKLLGGARIENYGEFEATANSQMVAGANPGPFVNFSTGTFIKTGGVAGGSTTFEIRFENRGLVDLNGREVRFDGGYTQTGATAITRLNSGTLASNGKVEIFAGTLEAPGVINPGASKVVIGRVPDPDPKKPPVAVEPVTVTFGFAIGTLTISGDLVVGARTEFHVGISGRAAGTEYDQIVVTGTADLTGTLSVTLQYDPVAGDSFKVLTAARGFATVVVNGVLIDSRFGSVELPDPGLGLGWAPVSYANNAVTLRVVQKPL